jgi:hypothetical protein
MKCHGKAAISGTGKLLCLPFRFNVGAAKECSDAMTAAGPLLAFKAMAQRNSGGLAMAGHAELSAGASCKSCHR